MAKISLPHEFTTYPLEIQQFALELQEVLQDALDTYGLPHSDEYTSAISILCSCLDSHSSPEGQLQLLGYGAFKEAYKISDSLIIKFCSQANRTQDEIRSYNDIQLSDYDKMFIPTYFLPLPRTLPITYLDDEDSYSNPRYYWNSNYQSYHHNPDFQPYEFNYCEIQLLALPVESWDEEEHFPICEQAVSPCYNTAWQSQIINVYGTEFYHEFLNFLAQENIHDLHIGNLGFLNQKPIILDWMS